MLSAERRGEEGGEKERFSERTGKEDEGKRRGMSFSRSRYLDRSETALSLSIVTIVSIDTERTDALIAETERQSETRQRDRVHVRAETSDE